MANQMWLVFFKLTDWFNDKVIISNASDFQMFQDEKYKSLFVVKKPQQSIWLYISQNTVDSSQNPSVPNTERKDSNGIDQQDPDPNQLVCSFKVSLFFFVKVQGFHSA